MEVTIVTFENEAKTKKAVVTVKWDKANDQVLSKIEFDPQIEPGAKDVEFYVRAAASYMRELVGEQPKGPQA